MVSEVKHGIHPALVGKSVAEVNSIINRLQDGLHRAFYGENNWISSREQNEAIDKVSGIFENYLAYDFKRLLKAIADKDKEEVFRIATQMADDAIESVVDQIVYPRGVTL